jgi:hypothetical protein
MGRAPPSAARFLSNRRMTTEPRPESSRSCPVCGAPLSDSGAEPCRACGTPPPPDHGNGIAIEFLDLPEMRYQNAYVWLVLVASLDVVLTMLVLFVWSGHEVNPIAAMVIEALGFGWAIGFKYAMIVLVIVICESIGRRDDRFGWWLSMLAIILNLIPVGYTFVLLLISEPPVAM